MKTVLLMVIALGVMILAAPVVMRFFVGYQAQVAQEQLTANAAKRCSEATDKYDRAAWCAIFHNQQ
jgi:type II secretory pathway pseudopilin PulG